MSPSTQNAYITQRHTQNAEKYVQDAAKNLSKDELDFVLKRLRRASDDKTVGTITDEEMDLFSAMEGVSDDDFLKFEGLSTGYPTLDTYLCGIRPGDVLVMGAYTNLGKSTLSMDLCFTFCEAGQNVLFLAMEDNEQELTTRTLGLLKGRGITAAEAKKNWKGKFHRFPMAKKSMFFRDKFAIIPTIEAMVMTRNINVVCLDMLNDIVDPVNDRDADDFMVALKEMCDSLGVVLLTTTRLREPKGLTAKSQEREKFAPDEDSIYGRGMIKYLATKIITLAMSSLHDPKPQVAFSGYETQYLSVNVCKNRTGGNTKREGKVITMEFLRGQTVGMKYKDLGAEDLNV